MIAVWYADEPVFTQHGPREFIARLEQHGVVVHRIDRPSETEIQLVFAPLDDPAVLALSAAARARTILVVERGSHRAAEEEAQRQALGLGGLVDSSAWARWCSGAAVGGGLFGTAAIATAAGLEPTSAGLRTPTGGLRLPVAVARFLLAAETVLKK